MHLAGCNQIDRRREEPPVISTPARCDAATEPSQTDVAAADDERDFDVGQVRTVESMTRWSSSERNGRSGRDDRVNGRFPRRL